MRGKVRRIEKWQKLHIRQNLEYVAINMLINRANKVHMHTCLHIVTYNNRVSLIFVQRVTAFILYNLNCVSHS